MAVVDKGVISVDLDTLSDELDAMLSDLPASVEWQGRMVVGAKGEATNGSRVTAYAFEAEADLLVSIPTRSLSGMARPRDQDRVLVDGARYEVVNVAESRDGLVFRMALRADSRRVP